VLLALMAAPQKSNDEKENNIHSDMAGNAGAMAPVISIEKNKSL
jgi:hypothetical protein